MDLTGVDSREAAGFMDQGLVLGEGWSDRLSDALATCRVFVPLYSPRYFRSQWCGKEWAAFASRSTFSLRGTDGAETASRAIVPIQWVPMSPGSLPRTAAELQYLHDLFGPDYVTEGLYALSKLNYFRNAYEFAVHRIAQRVVELAETTVTPVGPRRGSESFPDAFESARSPRRRLRIAVVAPTVAALPADRSSDYYGASALDWNPYHPSAELSLGRVAVEIARGLEFLPVLEDFDTVAESLLTAASARSPVLLLVDRWAVRDPGRRARLAALDASAPPWASALVPWNTTDPDSLGEGAPDVAEVEAVIPELLRAGRSAVGTAGGSITTHEEFQNAFAIASARALAEYARLEPLPTGPAPSPVPSPAPSPARPRLRPPFGDERAGDDQPVRPMNHPAPPSPSGARVDDE
ncbi:FxsC C-terminal domain-containing protein [Streptacidiphilus jiangxiensis]|uniref:FxsC C-terminal domain-containing protein n=2 Tax=Streptacidiphilus jiangxiensis TaxID=235985 RepID=A0A1H7HWQ5_STRJI|nr:FxsC C-terminal domain-containing protein [Streptacidiphilus jiangxiensis]